MFAVGLGEHHQLDIRWVAAKATEALHQVVDLVRRQGQAQGQIGGFDGAAATCQHVYGLQRPRLRVGKEALRLGLARQHRFGHAVVQGGPQGGLVGYLASDGVRDATLDAAHTRKAAVVGHVSGLG